MFYGEYHHSIDLKGRLIIPSRLREIAKDNTLEKFYATRGLDRCLFLFAEEEWREQENRLKSLSFARSEYRQFNRLFFSGAAEIHCDSQGRILIPGYLKDYADIRREAVLVGVSTRIEIWSEQQWKAFYEASKDTYERVAEKLMDDSAPGRP